MLFILHQIYFFLSIALILFIPGYFLLLAIFGKSKTLSDLEKFVISFGLSILIIDFLMLLMGKAGILFTCLSIISAILIFSATCYGIFFLKNKKTVHAAKTIQAEPAEFSKNQTILIIFILFLTIFIKSSHLSSAIFPTSTDLGHHMYWSKLISETGELPIYQERNIIERNGAYAISKPEPIIDFIIGEHLIFSAISLISGANYISAFPSLVLFLINIFGILSVFILSARLFEKYKYGKNVAIATLLFAGPIYAISNDQAKYVSGGVIGNIIGVFFIILALYFYLRAFNEKSRAFFSIAILITMGLIYTHHLSAYIFIYILFFSTLAFILLNYKNTGSQWKEWRVIFFSPAVFTVISFSIIMLLLVYLPNYIGGKAIETAVGTPEKSTRLGITLSQLKFTVGEPRFILGIAGLFILLFIKKWKNYTTAILTGWFIAMLLMSVKPQWLLINIPSDRIANYASYPYIILGSFALVWFFYKIKTLTPLWKYSFFLLSIFILTSGFFDNALSLKTATNSEIAVQTFHASDYLSKKTSSEDLILKDHNFIVADSMIKLYFMYDLNYPFSRGYFKRYNDKFKAREMCTLWMISTPDTENGGKCFQDTGINFIMINPANDGAQFEKIDDFSKIYSGDNIGIYHKN